MEHLQPFTGEQMRFLMQIKPQRAVPRLSPAARADRVVRVPSRHEFGEAAPAARALDGVAAEAEQAPSAADSREHVHGGGEHYAQRPGGRASSPTTTGSKRPAPTPCA